MLFRVLAFIFIFFQFGCTARENTLHRPSGLEIQKTGQKYASWFYSSELDSLKGQILDRNYTLSRLADFRNQVEQTFGATRKVLNEQFGIEPWQFYYIQYCRFERQEQPVRTLFTFDEQGKILKFSVIVLENEAQSRFGDYVCKTDLSLPFNGEWYVGWGGRTINENQHAVSREQRYAYDFIIRKGAKTFAGDGKQNADYYCYEQPVLAPGAGRIVEVYDGIPENKIGEMPHIHGNRLVIDHGNDEYSVMSHFKKGSFTVRENEVVEKGQILGLCGNSGHSSEPHIHFHLQNTPDINNGEGLPALFHSYLSNGIFKKSGEPKIGEYVENYSSR